MNRGQMRTLLRARIKEKQGTSQWSDANLNLLLDLATQDVQKVFLRSSAASFAVVWTCLHKQSKTRTPVPAGFIHELMVEVKDADGEYVQAAHNKNMNITKWDADGDAQPEYVILGRWLKIKPAPASDVTAGIRLTFVRAITMEADCTVPDIRLIWHNAIVDRAKQFAFGETEDRSDFAEKLWLEIRELVPTVHRESNTGQSRGEISGINKDY